MKASVHLGPNYNENLEVHRSTTFEELKNLFDITQRLILEHEAEILNVSTLGQSLHARDLHLLTTW